MIKEHRFNSEESLQMYEQYHKYLEPKACYHNIFRLVSQNQNKLKSGVWKIAYGYVQVFADAPFMVRHCFLVNANGEAVDPTFYTTKKPTDHAEAFISFKQIESMEEYMDLIHQNNDYPDLVRIFRPDEKPITETWAEKNEKVLLG